MEITYGKGFQRTPAAVLNPHNGEVYSLDGFTPPKNPPATISGMSNPTAQMFAYLGGELLTSNGKGGAGRIPDEAGFVQLSVLNADFKWPEAPKGTCLTDGRRAFVTSRRAKLDHNSYVILVRDDANVSEVFAVPNRATAVHRAITEPDSLRTGKRTARMLRSYAPWDEDNPNTMTCKEKQVVTYAPFGKMGELAPSRVLDLLFWGDLFHRGAYMPRRLSPWLQGLGLATGVDGQLYRNVGGILRSKVNPSKKLSEQIDWVTFITDPRPGFNDGDLYIIKRGNKPTLNGRYSLRPESDPKAGRRQVVEISPAEAKAMTESGQLLPKYVDSLLAPPTAN